MSPRERRTLALGAAAIIVTVLALRVAPAGWRAAGHIREELQARAELLARSRAAVGGAQALQDSSVAIKTKLLAQAPKILAGRQEAEALADFSGRLSVSATASRMRLSRTDAVPDSTRAGTLRRLTVRLKLEGDCQGTLAFLGALARSPTVMTAVDVRILAPNPTGANSIPEMLETELTVQGWYLAREAAK